LDVEYDLGFDSSLESDLRNLKPVRTRRQIWQHINPFLVGFRCVMDAGNVVDDYYVSGHDHPVGRINDEAIDEPVGGLC
jgi:hypothetical protein